MAALVAIVVWQLSIRFPVVSWLLGFPWALLLGAGASLFLQWMLPIFNNRWAHVGMWALIFVVVGQFVDTSSAGPGVAAAVGAAIASFSLPWLRGRPQYQHVAGYSPPRPNLPMRQIIVCEGCGGEFVSDAQFNRHPCMTNAAYDDGQAFYDERTAPPAPGAASINLGQRRSGSNRW